MADAIWAHLGDNFPGIVDRADVGCPFGGDEIGCALVDGETIGDFGGVASGGGEEIGGSVGVSGLAVCCGDFGEEIGGVKGIEKGAGGDLCGGELVCPEVYAGEFAVDRVVGQRGIEFCQGLIGGVDDRAEVVVGGRGCGGTAGAGEG